MPWKNEPELSRVTAAEDDVPELTPQRPTAAGEKTAIGPETVSSGAIDSTLSELVRELKRRRRWGIAIKTVGWLAVIGLLAGIFFGQREQSAGSHTALVRLDGVIAQGYDASAEDVLTGLINAFESDTARGVILAINSPGGSPVQSDMLYQEIKRLNELYEKPLIAVIGDVGASGGYYTAVAADTIYANPSSIVGSIGVLMNGFGFVELMEKLGIERRLITSGANKGSLDPFSPSNDKHLEHAQSVIAGVHQTFIDVVRESRGTKLDESNDELFSGQFWNGKQAYDLGLIDGLKNYRAAARDDIGEEIIIDYTVTPDVLERFSQTLGATIARQLTFMLGDAFPEIR